MITALDLYEALNRMSEKMHPADQPYGLNCEGPKTEADLKRWTLDGCFDLISAAEELNKIIADKRA